MNSPRDRILMRIHEIASMMLMDGALSYEIDEAMESFGFIMGIYEAEDLLGLEVGYRLRKLDKVNRNKARRYIPIADRMVEEGRLGKQVNVGWYRYPGGQGKVEDPIVEDLIVEESWFAKVERRKFSETEILERLLAVLINETCLILANKEHSIDELDNVLKYDLNFPQERGGILGLSDQVGSETVLISIKKFAEEDALIWQPASSLINAVKSGKTLQEYFDV